MVKKDRFSIRKVKGIVGSVLLGSLIFAPGIVDASTYYYVDEASLTSAERAYVKQGKPDEKENTYVLVYQKAQLPQTGASAPMVLTAFGLFAVGTVLVVMRKKKVATVLMVCAFGLSVFPTVHALDLAKTLHESSDKGNNLLQNI